MTACSLRERNLVDQDIIRSHHWDGEFTAAERASLRRLCAAPDLWSKGQCLAWLEKGGEPWPGVKPPNRAPDEKSPHPAFEIELLEQLARDPRPQVSYAAREQLCRLRDLPYEREEGPLPYHADRVKESHPHFHRELRRAVFNSAERNSLQELAESADLPHLGTCAEWVELGHAPALNRGAVLAVLEELAQHSRDGLRCQALNLLGELYDQPHLLWPVIERLAAGRMTVRGELSAFVLEYFLAEEASFHTYFPRIVQIVEAGDLRMLGVLNGCWVVGHAKEHVAEIDELLRRHGVEPLHGFAREEKVVCKRRSAAGTPSD